MVTRAGIVVTGTEVLTGRVTDLNGPWLAEQLRRLGVDVGQTVVVGDRPDDLRAAPRLPRRRRRRPGHHLRRSRPDRRRPDRRDRRGRAGPAVGAGPGLEQRIAAIVERLSAAAAGGRPGRHRRRHPQAGARARRRRRCSSRSAPRPGWSSRRPRAQPARPVRGAARAAARAAGHVAGRARRPRRGRALGRSGRAAAADAAAVGHARVASWPPRCASPRRPSWTGWRSPRACARASWRSSPGSPPRRPALRALAAAVRRRLRATRCSPPTAARSTSSSPTRCSSAA